MQLVANRNCWVLLLFLLPMSVLSGSLEPPGPPAPTMKTLNEIPPAWSQILDSTDGDQSGCDSTRFKRVMSGAAVLDLETGLVWQRSPETVTSWTGAQSSCPNKTTGNRRGWHLPWLEEMQSLVDPSQSNPSLPLDHPFMDVTAVVYWTSSTLVNNNSNALQVTLSTGGVFQSPKTLSARYWCVRGGTPSIVNHN